MNTSLELLKKSLAGNLLTPGNSRFEEACQIWNARLVKTPAAILQCANAADAAAGVMFANEEGLPVAVRGGGHRYAGLATMKDALMIDFS